MRLFDMHCHLDFLADDATRAVAGEGASRGIFAFSATVTPAGYERATALLGDCPNVRVGVGMHPWWVADGSIGAAEEEAFSRMAADSRFIGEVGLDFAPRRDGTQAAQVAAFSRAFSLGGRRGGRVYSIHAVRSATKVLDMLDEQGAASDSACILHWFSGTSAELSRAVGLGCYFSVGPRMVSTKRGRAYVRSVPRDRLLLETDMPAREGAAYSVDEWERDLLTALRGIAEARGDDPDELARAIASSSARLLGMDV